jgi:hypothetical protein
MDDKLTLIDAEFGLCVTVTPVFKGFAVTFIDSDADAIIATRLYDDKAKAHAYAYGLISGTKSPIVVNL